MRMTCVQIGNDGCPTFVAQTHSLCAELCLAQNTSETTGDFLYPARPYPVVDYGNGQQDRQQHERGSEEKSGQPASGDALAKSALVGAVNDDSTRELRPKVYLTVCGPPRE